MSNLSTFKKRWIEKWCLEVRPFLQDGTMCTMTGVYHDEDPHLQPKRGVPCCGGEISSTRVDSLETVKLSINGERVTDYSTGALPFVKLAYSHCSRRKLNRLVNGLPIIHHGITDGSEEVKHTSILVTPPQQANGQHSGRRRQNMDTPTFKKCEITVLENCSPSSPVNRQRNAFSPNRSICRARQKLHQKSMTNSGHFENYIPIQNSWVQAELMY